MGQWSDILVPILTLMLGLGLGIFGAIVWFSLYKYATKEEIASLEKKAELAWEAANKDVDDIMEDVKQSESILSEQNKLLASHKSRINDIERRFHELERDYRKISHISKQLVEAFCHACRTTKHMVFIQPALVASLRGAPGDTHSADFDRELRRLQAGFGRLRIWHEDHPEAEDGWGDLLRILEDISSVWASLYAVTTSSRTRHNVSRCRKMLDSFRRLSITLGRPDLQPPLEEELGLADLDSSERAPLQLAPPPSEMVKVGAQAIEDAQLRYQRSVEALWRVMQWSASRLVPALDQYRELPEGRELVARAFEEIGITNIDAATGKPCYLWEDDAG